MWNNTKERRKKKKHAQENFAKNTKTNKKKQRKTHKKEEIKKEGDNFLKEADNVNRQNYVV